MSNNPYAPTIGEEIQAGVLGVLANVPAPLWADLAHLAEKRDRGELSPEAWQSASLAAIEPAITRASGGDATQAERQALAAAARRIRAACRRR